VTSVGPFTPDIVFQEANNISSIWARENIDLQWSEAFFRGFFTLEVTPQALNATYYSMRDISESMESSVSNLVLLSCRASKLSVTLTVSRLPTSSSMLAITACLVLLLGVK
jgi:hypothetical protein